MKKQDYQITAENIRLTADVRVGDGAIARAVREAGVGFATMSAGNGVRLIDTETHGDIPELFEHRTLDAFPAKFGNAFVPNKGARLTGIEFIESGTTARMGSWLNRYVYVAELFVDGEHVRMSLCVWTKDGRRVDASKAFLWRLRARLASRLAVIAARIEQCARDEAETTARIEREVKARDAAHAEAVRMDADRAARIERVAAERAARKEAAALMAAWAVFACACGAYTGYTPDELIAQCFDPRGGVGNTEQFVSLTSRLTEAEVRAALPAAIKAGERLAALPVFADRRADA